MNKLNIKVGPEVSLVYELRVLNNTVYLRGSIKDDIMLYEQDYFFHIKKNTNVQKNFNKFKKQTEEKYLKLQNQLK